MTNEHDTHEETTEVTKSPEVIECEKTLKQIMFYAKDKFEDYKEDLFWLTWDSEDSVTDLDADALARERLETDPNIDKGLLPGDRKAVEEKSLTVTFSDPDRNMKLYVRSGADFEDRGDNQAVWGLAIYQGEKMTGYALWQDGNVTVYERDRSIDINPGEVATSDELSELQRELQEILDWSLTEG